MFTSFEKHSGIGRKLIFLFVLFVVPSVLAWRGNGAERPLDNSVLSFTSEVYKKVASHVDKSSNLLLCPLAVQLLLALLTDGAGGHTRQEMRKVLLLPEETNAVSEYFFKLIEEIQFSNRNPKHLLLIATKMYARKGLNINPKYKDQVRGFEADIEGLDFAQQTLAANRINEWVARRTKNQINNLISPDDLTMNTQLLLVNALYFDAKWHMSFDPKNTTNLPFFTPRGNSTVPMMRNEQRIKYADIGELDAKFIEIPYHDYQYYMSIMVPNRIDGLKDLESTLDQVLDLVQKQSYIADVTLEMPKFKIQDNRDYTPILQSMGITEAFSERADFSGIVGNQRLGISKVISKTRMSVDEEGTVATAATSVGAITLSIPQTVPKVNLRIDRPFLFIISSADHSAPIFIGRYAQPEKEALNDNQLNTRFNQPQNINNNKKQPIYAAEPQTVQPLPKPDHSSTSGRHTPEGNYESKNNNQRKSISPNQPEINRPSIGVNTPNPSPKYQGNVPSINIDNSSPNYGSQSEHTNPPQQYSPNQYAVGYGSPVKIPGYQGTSYVIYPSVFEDSYNPKKTHY